VNTDTKTNQAKFTSSAVRRLVDQASASLSVDKDLQDLDAVLADLTAKADELSPEQQAQVNELSRLLAADPEAATTAGALKQDAAFELTATEDKMQLLLSIRPALAGGRDVAVDDIVAAIKQRQIERGVSMDAIRRAVAEAADGVRVDPCVIVSGEPSTEGEPEHVELFARTAIREPLERIDLATVLQPEGKPPTLICCEGDVVLKRIAPKPGRPGFNALGQAIEPPKPATLTITSGPNVAFENDEYRALVSGVLLFDGGRIEVRRMLVVDQDVKANRDAIDFDGDVHIRAAVRSGAEVRATGNIVIDGNVEAATIESTGGDVELNHGVTGQHEAMIRAEGDVTARFAENVTIFAGRDITIGMGVLHSRLIAGKAVHLTRGRGQMVGGSAMAGELIEIKQVGSTSGVATELCVGLSRAVMEKLGQLDEQNARLKAKREEARELADQMQRTVGDPLKLQPAELKAYTELRRVQLVCDVKIKTLEDKREQVMAESARQTGGRVDVQVTLMPKVRVRIGDAELLNKEQHPRCRLVYKQADQSIDVVPLR